MFHLSFYYRADVAEVASRMYRISTRVWPGLDYVAERARARKTTKTKDVVAAPPSSSDDDVRPSMPPPTRMREMVKRRIRLGIVSPNLTWKHSVAEDFKGTMSRLDRTKFDITYIYVEEKNAERIDPFVRENEGDGYVVLTKGPSDFGDGAWVRRWHPIVESMEFDILFYLDLTLGKMTTRLAMAKLAPVQAVSHGHPLTSGIPSSIMDYYISWGMAELDYDTASTHYTERLKLLPTNTLHQYYTPRADEYTSLMDGQNYRRLVDDGRAKTFPDLPPDGNWYTCMQKPFKLFPGGCFRHSRAAVIFCCISLLTHPPNKIATPHPEFSRLVSKSEKCLPFPPKRWMR